MKIVQTFWSGNQSVANPLAIKGGWLSPEYHWMSWALSCYQLRRFYTEVELITDAVGKHILIDELKLPYTSYQVVLDEALASYPQQLWALAKIYAYSLQSEPFLHVDSDIYIWQHFSELIEGAPLVAQNYEIDFPFYQAPLRTMEEHFENIPTCMKQALRASKAIHSCNTGVIGGYQIRLFKAYKESAFELIDSNLHQLDKVDINHFNICFEQFLYFCLAQQERIDLTYVIDNKGHFDPTYPGFANFHLIPTHEWFIHAMAEYKRNEAVCEHLSRRLRQDYPEVYYSILRRCKKSGIDLHGKQYTFPELDPSKMSTSYFISLKDQDSSQSYSQWVLHYGQDYRQYAVVERIFSQSNQSILRQHLRQAPDVELVETENPVLQQTLRLPKLSQLTIQEVELDPLNMLLWDAFSQSTTIGHAIQSVSAYFPDEEVASQSTQFQSLVLERIRELLYLNALQTI